MLAGDEAAAGDDAQALAEARKAAEALRDIISKKPDPVSYTRLMERMGLDPQHCWFIDDKKSNVTGARLAGLAGHHFVSHAQLLPEVRAMGFAA